METSSSSSAGSPYTRVLHEKVRDKVQEPFTLPYGAYGDDNGQYLSPYGNGMHLDFVHLRDVN
jgi:hypothetical protein